MKWFSSYLGIVLVMFFLFMGLNTILSDVVSDRQVIQPTPEVKCIIVSRNFNTSVDCWQVKGE